MKNEEKVKLQIECNLLDVIINTSSLYSDMSNSTMLYRKLVEMFDNRKEILSNERETDRKHEHTKKVCPNCGDEHNETDCQGYCTAACLQEAN